MKQMSSAAYYRAIQERYGGEAQAMISVGAVVELHEAIAELQEQVTQLTAALNFERRAAVELTE